MKRINFFESYKKTGKSVDPGSRKRLFRLLGIIAGIIIIVVPLYMGIEIYRINTEIEKREAIVNKRESQERVREIAEKEKQLSELVNRNKKLEKVNTELSKLDVIGGYIVSDITGSLPPEVFMQSLDINPEEIEVAATSRNMDNAAFFENNLRKVGPFEKLHMATIDKKDDFYEFNIKAAFKNQGGEKEE